MSELLQPAPRGHGVEDLDALAQVVVESDLFLARERGGAAEVARYELRESGLKVFLRHGSSDIGVLEEIFVRRLYDPPAPVTAALASAGSPLRALDLGGNIGLFGAHLLGSFDAADITALEPDRYNLALLERCIASNGRAEHWRSVRACAGVEEGSVLFHEGRFAVSRVAEPGDGSPAGTVAVVDVLPLLESCDLLKMDMEGGEWAVLADSRFATALLRAVVLEFHPHGCPGPDPRSAAEDLLADAGYSTEVTFDGPDGVGMLWAWRAGP